MGCVSSQPTKPQQVLQPTIWPIQCERIYTTILQKIEDWQLIEENYAKINKHENDPAQKAFYEDVFMWLISDSQRLKEYRYCNNFVDYVLFGSLSIVEIASWYLQPDRCFYAMADENTHDIARSANFVPKCINMEPSFRCFPKDVARNPIDIYMIWQNVAFQTRQCLNLQFPNELSDLILNYCIRPLASPAFRAGLLLFQKT